MVRAYGLWLRALARVAPSRAERALFKRFCTPARRPVAPEPGLYDRRWDVFHGDRRLPVWSGGEGRPVLLVHGWDSHAAFWDRLARTLMAVGHHVVAFDLPAHGAAGGRRTNVFDMADAVAAVAREVGPLNVIVGHSAGATATALALRDGAAADRAVLIAAPSIPVSFIHPLADSLGLSEERTRGALDHAARAFGRDPYDADTVAAAARLRIPGLVIHDRDDSRAPWVDGRAIADAWNGARLLSTRGLGHYRLVFDDAVIGAILGFVREGSADASIVRRAAS